MITPRIITCLLINQILSQTKATLSPQKLSAVDTASFLPWIDTAASSSDTILQAPLGDHTEWLTFLWATLSQPHMGRSTSWYCVKQGVGGEHRSLCLVHKALTSSLHPLRYSPPLPDFTAEAEGRASPAQWANSGWWVVWNGVDSVKEPQICFLCKQHCSLSVFVSPGLSHKSKLLGWRRRLGQSSYLATLRP